MIFLALSGKMVLFFRKIWSYSLDGKWRIIFLKKYMEIWYIISVYSEKMVFLFPANMILPFCQKSKDDPIPKKLHLGMTFPVSLKNRIFILENTVFFLMIIKDYKKSLLL